ncbi:SDR family NAD(P)-dependent oxidoreductase [Streptomyces sp. NBC_00102]|uniref:SDR family NAD(P)-dependent oxidoreductase n=1 Tax=Streptomyces sp. NBC_00102 TaxID=2975652 RepID=UPI0022528255|nr:oxidoreductase [Streptomyces sp. NBC_00102]MCX5401739.1 oxidoreductase [Streptomyces sp. NBC_00102]
MDLGLSHRIAIVTGASRGIGLAVARALVREGATVVAGARGTTPELEALAGSGRLLAVEVDLSDPDGPRTLVDAAVSAYGGVDVLVNNVGAVRPRVDGFLKVTDEDWEATLTVNFLAAVRATRAVLPHMAEKGEGCVVTVSSVNAFLPDPLVIDYGAAKAALSNFCKAVSKEFGPRGIRVNTVSPGPVATALWLGDDGVAASVSAATGGSPQSVAEQAAGGTATGRFTRPEEIADLVAFLAGDRGGNITGADFVIDGGLVTTL